MPGWTVQTQIRLLQEEPEIFTVIYLKFKQRGKTSGYFVKMMQMEKQPVKILIRLFPLEEQSDLGLHCFLATSEDPDQTSSKMVLGYSYFLHVLPIIRTFMTCFYSLVKVYQGSFLVLVWWLPAPFSL